MRHRAKAMQVAYGTPFFVTLSPAEKHQVVQEKRGFDQGSCPAESGRPLANRCGATQYVEDRCWR